MKQIIKIAKSNPKTTIGACLIIIALVGGYLADRFNVFRISPTQHSGIISSTQKSSIRNIDWDNPHPWFASVYTICAEDIVTNVDYTNCVDHLSQEDIDTCIMGCHLDYPPSWQIEKRGNLSRVEGSINVCISCHDGAIGTNPEMNHRVGQTYQEFQAKNGLADPNTPTEWKNLFNIPLSIADGLLTDGKTTCVSCHNPHAPPPRMLKINGPKSPDCQVCHQK